MVLKLVLALLAFSTVLTEEKEPVDIKPLNVACYTLANVYAQ